MPPMLLCLPHVLVGRLCLFLTHPSIISLVLHPLLFFQRGGEDMGTLALILEGHMGGIAREGYHDHIGWIYIHQRANHKTWMRTHRRLGNIFSLMVEIVDTI